jgi:hypothetical protein
MSKEMDLLRRLAEGDNRGDFFISNELLKEIQELLAQPECEPLTPQQISEGNQSMFNVTREAFVKGVKFAEDMHGIGGE